MNITAIVTTHNSEKYLHECLTSAVRECDQVIVVDNASTDSTHEILKSYGVTFMVHPQDTNGPVEGYNEALAIAKGELVIFLDADDALSPGTRSVMAEAPEADWYVVNLQVMDEHSWFTETWDYSDWPTDKAGAYERARKTLSLPVSLKGFFRRSWIESNGLRYVKIPGTEHSPDVATCFAWLDADPRIVHIPVPLVRYRMTSTNFAYHIGEERSKMQDFIREMTA